MLNIDKLKIHQNKLENHSLLVENHISNKQQLATFMEHHVYCVWDFMSLVKGLQNSIAPSSWPWQPSEHTKNGCARLLNDIIKTEESDYIDGRYLSHFDLYLEAMEEIGADNTVVKQFVNNVFSLGLFEAMNIVPEPSRKFMESTFGFIGTGKPHVMASAFAFGRETVIPGMYINMVRKLGISETDAPKFYAWLNRHIEVDEDDHGPSSLRLVEILCNSDPQKILEAQEAGHKSIDDKIEFWNKVENIIYD
jgi:hypothetical protein